MLTYVLFTEKTNFHYHLAWLVQLYGISQIAVPVEVNYISIMTDNLFSYSCIIYTNTSFEDLLNSLIPTMPAYVEYTVHFLSFTINKL